MRLGKREKQTLLILVRHRYRPVEIARRIQRSWSNLKSLDAKFPERRVLSSSISRSLGVLEKKGYISRSRTRTAEGRIRRFGLTLGLTDKGRIAAENIDQQLKRQMKELEEFKEFLL